jgi:hypothetical protein
LAVSHRESFLVSDNPVTVEGLFERCHGLLPPPFASLLERQIVVENTQCAIVFQRAEQIQRFKIIGTGFFV